MAKFEHTFGGINERWPTQRNLTLVFVSFV